MQLHRDLFSRQFTYREMFQKTIYKTVLFSSFLSIISSKICLKWRQHNDYLQIVCQVDDLHFPVALLGPNNAELAFCVIPHTDCVSHVSWVNATQHLTTSETVFLVHKDDSLNINGNWTCQHGSQEAFIEFHILDPVQKSAVLNVFVWAFAGVGIAFLIKEMFSMGTKYTNIDCKSCMESMVDHCPFPKDRLSCLSIFVFIVATALYAGIITIFTIIPYEDSDLGRCLFLFCGITYALLVLLSSGLKPTTKLFPDCTTYSVTDMSQNSNSNTDLDPDDNRSSTTDLGYADIAEELYL